MRLTLAVTLLALASAIDQVLRAHPTLPAFWLAYAVFAFALLRLVDLAVPRKAARGRELEEPEPFREWEWLRRGGWTP